MYDDGDAKWTVTVELMRKENILYFVVCTIEKSDTKVIYLYSHTKKAIILSFNERKHNKIFYKT